MAKHPLDVSDLVAEVADSNFEDERLNKRLKALFEGLAKDPSLSLPRAFDSAGLEAAYRFFSNPRVSEQEILNSHFEATRKRCGEGECLVVHDSTTFSYRFDGEREGLGRVQRSRSSSNQVFFAHVSLALSADGTRRPLGLAAFKTWTRGPERTGVESQRWEEQIRFAHARLGEPANAIHLADREADDFEMFHGLQRDGLRFIVRCQYDRRLMENEEAPKLRELFAATPATVEREVPLKRRKPRRNNVLRKIFPARENRLSTLCVAARTVTLKKPHHRWAEDELSDSLAINVVRVWEPNPPADFEPIEWYLYTSEPIETIEQQLAIVDHYRARWTIEEYFKVIKTGCIFERRQLQDYDALVNLLATFAPIAYRLLLIRTEAARAPDLPATNDLLPADHLDVLRARGRMRLPPEPTARQIYLAIAALGGHIKYSGNPGWLTLARGYEKLEVLAEGWRAAKLQLASDQG